MPAERWNAGEGDGFEDREDPQVPVPMVFLYGFCVLGVFQTVGVVAQEVDKSKTTVARPSISSNRWSEDWSVLANPALQKRPWDRLKYLPLSTDPSFYLSWWTRHQLSGRRGRPCVVIDPSIQQTGSTR
ncbi:MAG: hypothetical protein ABI216_12455 [Devosia sp.]